MSDTDIKLAAAALVAALATTPGANALAQQPTRVLPAVTGTAAQSLSRAGAGAQGAGVDLATLAKGYADSVPQGASSLGTGPALFVFISLSMPQQSLARLIEQAEGSGAVLVLRGLERGSMRTTAGHIKQLIGQRKVGIQIDPLAFDRYGVRAVPTFVLAAAGTAAAPCSGVQCYSNAYFTSVAGDVSMGHALQEIERRAPRFRAPAQALLKKLGG